MDLTQKERDLANGIPFRYSPSLGDMNCFKQVKYYLDREPRLESVDLERGIALHLIVDNYLKGTGSWHPLLPVQLREYLDSRKDVILPENLERELIVDEPEDNFYGKGIVDLVTTDGWIYDWKFPSKPWDQYKFDKYAESQGVVYPYYLRKLGVEVKGMAFLVCPSNPGKNGRPFSRLVIKDTSEAYIEQHIRKHKGRYRMLRNAYNNNVFPPTPTKLCNWCNWRNICEDRMR